MKRSWSSALMLLSLLAWGCPAFSAESTHNFDKWEPEISAYEQNARTNPPPKNALLFVGSSTIRLWRTLSTDFPDQKVINRGFGGSEIVDATHFADRVVFPYEPRMILFRAGGNDLWAGKSAETVFADYRDFVAKVHARLPQTQIVFISWSPSIARWKQADKEKALNAMVQAYVPQQSFLKYLDTWSVPLDEKGEPRPEVFAPDKLHFNAEGYRLLAERVREFLAKP